MFACAALASCSNDDLVENNGGNQATMKGGGYMTVQFSMSGNGSGRAFGDGGFTQGTADEVGVTSATFFFLDDNGNGCALPATIEGSNLAPWSNGSTSVDKKSSPVIVIKNPVTTPKQIVAILNTVNPFGIGTMPSLTQVRALSGDYTSQEASKFVMSNSVYVNGNAVMDAVEIPTASIKGTEDEAKESAPVVIPVERVLAKVGLETKDASDLSQTIDGITLTGEITGWWLDNTNPTSYLVKNLSTTYDYDWWNDASNKRSYWANSIAPAAYTHHTYKDVKIASEPWYCQENTSTDPTSLVLAVQWKVNSTATDLVRYMNKLYAASDFFTYVASNYNYKIKTVGADDKATYSSIENILSFKVNTKESPIDGLEDYEAQIEVADAPEGSSLVLATFRQNGDKTEVLTEETVTKATIQTAIQTSIPSVNLWKDGKAYYFKEIFHNTESELTGIVRNHLYKMNITKVSGLGTPVANPDLVIVPETPPTDKESYIAAEIEILSYKVVQTQNVEW